MEARDREKKDAVTDQARGRPAADIARAILSGTSHLSADDTVDSMLCRLLSNLAQHSGAHDAVLWHYDFGADRYDLRVASRLEFESPTEQREFCGPAPAEWTHGLYPPSIAPDRSSTMSLGNVELQTYSADELNAQEEDDRARHWRLLRGTRSLAVLRLRPGEEEIAAISLAFKAEDPRAGFDESLALCLAGQLVAALAVDRLTASLPMDRTASEACGPMTLTEKTAIKVARVGEALVDAAGELHDVDQLITAVLRIVSHALAIREGALWVTVPDSPMQLQYWLRDGSMLTPRELAELDNDANGISAGQTYVTHIVPDAEHLAAKTARACPLIVDHADRPGSTPLDAYLRSRSRSLELHAPLVVRGAHIGALSIFRPPDQPFTDAEIELAAPLARLVALGLQVVRVSSRIRVATVARERLAMVNRASDTLRRTADKLAEVPALEPFLEQVLESLVETFSGCGGSLYWHDEGKLILSLEEEQGRITRLGERLHPNSAVLQNLVQSGDGLGQRLKAGLATVVDRSGLRSSAAIHDWMLSLGIHTVLIVPLNIGGRSFGCMSVRLAEARTLGDEDVELARALSTQAVLAMELTRLAEEAKAKATAEARSAELMKANNALRSTLDVVASGADTDVVLSHALRVIADLFVGGNGSATLWLTDEEAEKQRPHLALEDDETVHPTRSRFVAPETFELELDPKFKMHFSEGKAFAVSVDQFKPEQAAFLRHLGVRSVVTLPMSLRGRLVGSFMIYVPCEAAEPTCERMEMAQALAHQATLVLQLTRLAEQAKRAAVASERESAALTRAAELTEANAALKRSLDVLASGGDLDRFLGGLLGEIGHRVGANRVVLYLEEEVGQRSTSRLSWSDEGGVAKNAGEHLGEQAADALVDIVHTFSMRRLPHIHVVQDLPHGGPERLAALRGASIHSILHLPLVLGDRCFGAVVVLMSTARDLPSEELELVQAFAHQATLALHLARLSAQSQSVAILQERARFAQEIHDGIVQSFIGIGMQLNQMKGAEDCPARQRATQLAEHGLAEARRAVKALRPLQLVSKSLIDAVTDMARAVIGSATTVKVTSSGEWKGLVPDAENHLFRLIQEAVNNIVKHAKATEVAIEFSSGAGEVSVLVSDNGIGFNVEAQGTDRGYGLFSMQQRAVSIGAKLAIVSAPGQGTQVFVSLDRGAAQPPA